MRSKTMTGPGRNVGGVDLRRRRIVSRAGHVREWAGYPVRLPELMVKWSPWVERSTPRAGIAASLVGKSIRWVGFWAFIAYSA